MARRYQTGFEVQTTTANVGEFFANTTNPSNISFVNSGLRTGTLGSYALKIANNNAATMVESTAGLAIATSYHRFYFKKSATPSIEAVLYYVANSGETVIPLALTLTTDNKIKVYTNTNATTVGTSTKVLDNDTWYLIEVYLLCSASVGVIQLKIDGNSEVSGSSLNTGGTNFDRASYVQSPLSAGMVGADFYFDDAAINDTTGSYNNSWIGAGTCFTIFPESDTATIQWTPSTGTTHYNLIDENPPVNSDYVSINVSGTQVDMWNLANCPAGLGSSDGINAITVGGYGGGDGTTARYGNVRLQDSNSNNADSSNTNWATSSWLSNYPALIKERTWEGTPVAITKAYIDGCKGAIVHASSNTRLIKIATWWITVDAVPAGGQTVTPSVTASSSGAVTPELVPGAVTLNPTLLGTTSSILDPTAKNQNTISPSLTDVISGTINPTLIIGNVTLTPTLINSTSGIINPTLLVGAVTLSPSVTNVTSGILDPTVQYQAAGQTVAPSLTDVSSGVVNPFLVIGAATLNPNVTNVASGVLAPTLSVGEIIITPSTVNSTSGTLVPSVSISGITVTPSVVNVSSGTLDPTLVASAKILPNVTNANTGILSPTLIAAQTITPTIVSAGSGILAPSVSIPGQVTINSIDGDLIHGGTLVIHGSSFGSTMPTLLCWDNFDSGTNGQPLATYPMLGTWTKDNRPAAIYSNAQHHSGTQCSYAANSSSNGQWSNFHVDNLPHVIYFYQSFWFRFNHSGNTADIIKINQVHGTDGGDFAPGIMSGSSTLTWWFTYISQELGGGPGRNNWPTPPCLSDSSMAENTWHHLELTLKQSSGGGVADGQVEVRVNGYVVYPAYGVTTRDSASQWWTETSFGHGVVNNSGQTWAVNLYVDDAYLQAGWQRVEISDSPTWTTAHAGHREIQLPLSWSDNTLQVRLNQGSLSSLVNSYLYIIDSSGNVNANGFLLESGAGILHPAVTNSTSAVVNPSLVKGAVVKTPSIVNVGSGILTPTVQNALEDTITPQVTNVLSAVLTPTVNIGGLVVAPEPISATSGVLVPSVVFSEYGVLLPTLTDVLSGVFGPTVIPGGVTVYPQEEIAGEQAVLNVFTGTLAPQLNRKQYLETTNSNTTIISPTVIPGGVTKTPEIINSDTEVITPTIIYLPTGDVVRPQLTVATSLVIAPLVSYVGVETIPTIKMGNVREITEYNQVRDFQYSNLRIPDITNESR